MREELDIGRVLTDAFSVMRRNLLPFLGLSFLVNILPVAGIGAAFALGTFDSLLHPSPDAEPSTAILPIMFGTMLFVFVCHQFLQGIIAATAVQQLRGHDVTVGSCMGFVVQGLPTLCIVAVLAALGLAVGFMLCCIPGLILMTIWWVVIPVVANEDVGVGEAFNRSAYLTSGSRIIVFAILLISGVIYAVFGFVITGAEMAFSSAPAFPPPDAAPKVTFEPIDFVFLGVRLVLGLVFGVYTSCLAAVGYHEFQKSRGELDQQQVEEVFA